MVRQKQGQNDFWKPGDVKMVNNNSGVPKVNYKQFINY